MNRIAPTIATMAAAALLLAGCSTPPSNAGASGQPSKSDFSPCMVANTGGLTDKGFNQGAAEGIEAAASELGVEANIVESAQETDYAANITALIDRGCSHIVTVGFQLAEATKTAAEANPDVTFSIVDDDSIDLPNVKPIVFETSQAAFLAGYAAASYSTTGVVGTFGGQQIPPITQFMDGFANGVEYFNTQQSGSVRVVGWDVASQTGSFTGGFDANQTAKTVAQGLIDQNADVLLPVGGPIYISAGEAIRDSGRQIALVGVDSDVYETDPNVADLAITSILKQIAVGVKDAVLSAGQGQFDAAPFTGTLENGGVGIAPFHDFAATVPADLESQLQTIQAGIVDGSIKTQK